MVKDLKWVSNLVEMRLTRKIMYDLLADTYMSYITENFWTRNLNAVRLNQQKLDSGVWNLQERFM